MTKVTNISKASALLVVMLVCYSSPALALNEIQETNQQYNLTLENNQGSMQKYIIFPTDGDVAHQIYILRAQDTSLWLGVSSPGVIYAPLDASLSSALVDVSVYSENGYNLQYEFSSSSLICGDNSSREIPSIVSTGNILSNTWGQNEAVDTGGTFNLPAVWRPINTIAEYLASTNIPSAIPYDSYALAIGVRVDTRTVACTYTDTVTFTLTNVP